LNALIPKRVELHYHFQEGLPAIEADATQIRQVVMNLITNAAESIGERTGRVVIAVEQRYVSAEELEQQSSHAASPGMFLRLAVKDTGSGMNEETLGRVFDPFFTTKFKGRGLGMAAVLGIVRSHGGAIRIDSQEGAGTEVQILLPAKTAAHAPQARGDRGTILVVDDDDGVQSLARRALAARGYRVLSARNGLEGVRVYQEHRAEVRLIVMDLTMPQMGGVEAMRLIREGGSDVPVLLSSGYLADAEAEAEHFAGFLEKPYDFRELVSAVERVIARGE
jgi:CheY-like chemotaxis protein